MSGAVSINPKTTYSSSLVCLLLANLSQQHDLALQYLRLILNSAGDPTLVDPVSSDLPAQLHEKPALEGGSRKPQFEGPLARPFG